MDLHHMSITWLALGVEINKKMFVISKDPFLPEGRGPKINFRTPTIFEILQKFQKPLWARLAMPENYQFVSLIDMKLHAQNQLFTCISFWNIKVLQVSLGMPDHTHLNLHNQFITLINMKLHAHNRLPLA